MNADHWYLDTSAAVKVIRRERGSAALRKWMQTKKLLSSDLLRAELRRAARRVPGTSMDKVEEFLDRMTLLRCDVPMFERAGVIGPTDLRSLDALHLAAAEALGADLAGIVTYDHRLAEAARSMDIAVAAPR